jgi:transcriptional regulator with XRE-family HTH domain
MQEVFKLYSTFSSLIFEKSTSFRLNYEVFMTFGDRLAYARKQKGMRQADLGKLVGTSGDIIGKYERGENMPSIEVATKMADALSVTLDYLVKDAEYQNIDNDALKRLKLLEKLSPEDKAHIYALMDAFFAKSKLQSLMM